MAEQKLTGYASIDQPWLKYFDYEQPDWINEEPWISFIPKRPMDVKVPECTMYQLIYRVNKDHPDNTAITYFGRQWTYGDLFRDIDAAAAAFTAAGIKKGDVVCLSAVNMPEVVHAFYGLNKIGAVCNMVDPRSDVETLKHYIGEVNPKVYVTLNLNYPLVAKAVPDTSVEKVVILDVARSMPTGIRIAYKMTKGRKTPKIPYDDKTLTWTDFLKAGEGTEVVEAPWEKDACKIMMHTGGTTGMPKTVMTSDEAANFTVIRYGYLKIKVVRGLKWYNELPPFIIYGMVTSIHTPFAIGFEVILNPVFSPEDFPKNFKKYKPEYACGVLEHFRQLTRSPITKDMDMSFLATFQVGGDSVPVEEAKKIDQWLMDHGSPVQLHIGYGMTETTSTVCNTVPGHKEYGSVGFPLPHNIIKIMDPDTLEELKYNEIGEIWVHDKALMLGYLNEPEINAETLIVDEEGRKWMRTSDLGRITEDGMIYHEGRMRRIYMTEADGNGAKIFPQVPEKAIRAHKDVDDVCCAGRFKKDSTFYEVVAFIVKENKDRPDEELTAELKQIMKESVPTYMHPVDYVYIDALPLTPNNAKVDFRQLEERAAQMLEG